MNPAPCSVVRFSSNGIRSTPWKANAKFTTTNDIIRMKSARRSSTKSSPSLASSKRPRTPLPFRSLGSAAGKRTSSRVPTAIRKLTKSKMNSGVSPTHTTTPAATVGAATRPMLPANCNRPDARA